MTVTTRKLEVRLTWKENSSCKYKKIKKKVPRQCKWKKNTWFDFTMDNIKRNNKNNRKLLAKQNPMTIIEKITNCRIFVKSYKRNLS